MNVLTIDTGTSNSRVCLWDANRCIGQGSAPVGVRSTVQTGDNLALKRGLTQLCHQVLHEAGLPVDADVVVIAAGMITSNLGLIELPHLSAPVSLDALAAGMTCQHIPDFLTQPVWFIPGVKNTPLSFDLAHIDAMDMMRGEETETAGLLKLAKSMVDTLVILPGSHTKMVRIDSLGQISACLTTLSGELLDVISKDTLVADALDHRFCDDIDEAMLLHGAALCRQVGLSRVCFAIRIMAMFADLSRNQRANVLLGAILYTDLQAIKHSTSLGMLENTSMIIYGKPALQRGLALLIGADDDFRGEVFMPEFMTSSLSGLGALALAHRRGIVPSTFFDNENPK